MMYADEGGHLDPTANPHHYSREDHEDEEDDENVADGVSGRLGGHHCGNNPG